jgi:hypothetical protein
LLKRVTAGSIESSMGARNYVRERFYAHLFVISNWVGWVNCGQGMKQALASIIGGLAAGATTTLLMTLGHRAGLLHKTLAESAEDWLDQTANARRLVGQTGTTAIEQSSHTISAAGFGLGYLVLRKRVPDLPAWAIGALYGAALYAINIAGIAPLIGLTKGEHNAPAPVRAQRLGFHLLYGVITAVTAEILTARNKSYIREIAHV